MKYCRKLFFRFSLPGSLFVCSSQPPSHPAPAPTPVLYRTQSSTCVHYSPSIPGPGLLLVFPSGIVQCFTVFNSVTLVSARTSAAQQTPPAPPMLRPPSSITKAHRPRPRHHFPVPSSSVLLEISRTPIFSAVRLGSPGFCLGTTSFARTTFPVALMLLDRCRVCTRLEAMIVASGGVAICKVTSESP